VGGPEIVYLRPHIMRIAGVDDSERKASKQHLIEESSATEKDSADVPVPPNISKTAYDIFTLCCEALLIDVIGHMHCIYGSLCHRIRSFETKCLRKILNVKW